MRITLVVLVAAVSALFSGCTEDPNDKALSQLQQQTSKTLDQFSRDRNPQAAREQLKSHPRGRFSGLSGDSLILATANMQLAVSGQERADLLLLPPNINQYTETVNLTLRQLSDNSNQVQSIKNLLALSDSEISEMEKWIGSEPNATTLKGQIVLVRAQEKQLLDQKAVLEQKYQQARDTTLNIETQAEEKLRQAQTAIGDKKAELEKMGFDLKSRKKDSYLKAQEAEDDITNLNSQLAIVGPQLKRLEDNLQKASEKLKALQTDPSRTNLQKQQEELVVQINQQKELLGKQMKQLAGQLAEYQQKADAIVTSVNEVIEQYQQVKSRQLNPTLSMSMGEAYAMAGAVLASKIRTTADLGWRMEGILRTYESVIPEGLSSSIASKPDAEIAKKAMEYFDLASAQYENAQSSAGQLRQESQKAACAALKGQMLAIHSKIRLADRISDFDTAEKAQTQLDQLKEKSKEYGVLFSQSATAMLLTKGLDYTPQLPVDSTIVLEGIKKDFSGWRALRGTEAETEVERLLKHIDTLQKDYPGDEQITQFLTQEKQAMTDAKTKGFAVEEVPTAQDANTVNAAPAGGA
jgi:hypothetical protein